ncbi:hypothetical protein COU60_01285 [Candidatus Pacearchaeota archaeon CG10_big_fil_rev_8_21_14_0_10_34_76]|nr:MAG: hypothetical protein COU60_01285 [Candidatus Pacearchaeota archaeon CG10_big_fil_rev_8_21_14_0_10_34_76]
MPVNAGYEYFEAEKKYLNAQGLDEKIKCLEEMIKVAPKHKSSENLLAELKTRLKKFREKQEKGKKVGKGKKGIRKEGFQVALVGKVNSGKSALLGALTNARSFVSDVDFTTFQPEIGAMQYEGVKAQIVDLPSIGHKEFDYGVINNADLILMVVEKIDDIAEVEIVLERAVGKRIPVINKIDLLDENGKRKLEQQVRAKRIKDYVLISALLGEGILELKKKIFESMNVIRVFTKEPGKQSNNDPIVLPTGSNVEDVAESIYKGFSRQVKESRVTGPSGKFSNQKVGLKHILKDRDVVEFHTR